MTALGYAVVAVSADGPQAVDAPRERHGLRYTLLSDGTMDAARAVGIAFRVPDATYEQYKGFGVDLEEVSGHGHHELPVPAVFVVDTRGVIRFSYANPNYQVRIDPDLLLAAARAALK